MKKYRLKTQYKIMLYLIILFSLLYIMTIANDETILLLIYYMIAYQTIKALNEYIKKEDNRTAKIRKSSNK